LSLATLGTLAGAVVLYGVFAWVQRTVRSPLMDLRILTRRPVAAGTFLILVATALMIAIFFLGSFYLQHFQRYGALRTGLLFLPVAIAAIVGAQVAGRLVGQVGARLVALVGFLIAAGGMAVPAIWDGATAIVTGMSVGTIGIGAAFVAASTTTFAQIDYREAGLASGLLSTFHEFGASLGVAVVSSVAAASLSGTVSTGFTRGFTFAAITAAVAAALAVVVVPAFKSSTGAVHAH
jgi:predicted MFS family arabinose efflux permease